MELISTHPYLTLFLLSFFAATLLPLGSEWYLVLLILGGSDFSETLAVATIGNSLGACTSYLVGMWGSTFITHRLFRIRQQDLGRAEAFYRRFGCWSLLFSWVPVIGDPLCVIGGVFRVPFFYFFILILSGKFARYFTIAAVARIGTV
jgi:membrane protein YqaA with SNARE-associated domain